MWEISLPSDLADFHPVTKSVADWHQRWKSVKSVEILIPGVEMHPFIIHTTASKLNLLRQGKFHTDCQQRGKSDYSHCQRESSRNSRNLWTFAIYSRNEWKSSHSTVKGWWKLITLQKRKLTCNVLSVDRIKAYLLLLRSWPKSN